MSEYSLYILRCDQAFLYTGIALDVTARLQQHRDGTGAKFTRRFSQLELVYQVSVGNRAEAQSLEHRIKQLSKTNKEHIIRLQYSLTELKSEL